MQELVVHRSCTGRSDMRFLEGVMGEVGCEGGIVASGDD